MPGFTQVQVNEDCLVKYNELKSKYAYRFIIFRIDIDQVVVERTGSRDETYETLKAALPAKENRYAVFDFELAKQEVGPDGDMITKTVKKLVFMVWAPDESTIKQK